MKVILQVGMSLVALLAVAAAGFGADTAQYKVAEANTAITAASTAQAKAKADYARAVIAAKQKLVEQLSAILAKTTKAGDLDEAVKIRDKIVAVKAEIAALSAGEATGSSLLPLQDLLGDWKVSGNSSFTFKKGGVLELHNVSGRGEQQGIWKLIEKALVCVFKQHGETFTWTFDKLEGDTLNGTREFQVRADKPSSTNNAMITKIQTTTP